MAAILARRSFASHSDDHQARHHVHPPSSSAVPPRSPDAAKTAYKGPDSGPGETFVDPYKGGQSAIDKAAELFFFTEISRGACAFPGIVWNWLFIGWL